MSNIENKLTLSQAGSMLKLQDRLNSVINPDWIHGNANFLRAVFVESAEALEHYGWKWWKKQILDLPQVQIELVDILHFYLSQSLVSNNGSIVAAAEEITNDLERAEYETLDGKEHSLKDMDIPDLLEFIGALAVCKRSSFKLLEITMSRCSLTWSNAFTQYVSKNVLNIFRQDNGYKEGSYLKIWNGEEDNVHLTKFINELDITSPSFSEDLYGKLSAKYNEIVKANVNT